MANLRCKSKIFIDENKLKDYDIDTLVNFPIKYIYRLPTKAEWEYAASGGLDKENYPYGFEDLKFKYKNINLIKLITMILLIINL